MTPTVICLTLMSGMGIVSVLRDPMVSREAIRKRAVVLLLAGTCMEIAVFARLMGL